MSSYHLPSTPAITAEELARFSAASSDRRAFLRRAAGIGLTVPALRLLQADATAQEATPDATEGHAMPGDGYVGSDPESPSTGDESPVPTQVQPFVLYDPVLPVVEAGLKEITIVAKDATLYIARDVPYAAWTFDGSIPGRALRVVAGDEINFT